MSALLISTGIDLQLRETDLCSQSPFYDLDPLVSRLEQLLMTGSGSVSLSKSRGVDGEHRTYIGRERSIVHQLETDCEDDGA